MKKLVYLNGNLVPENKAKVSIFDRGFLYGDGLFETMRAYAGKIFRLERHLQRLFRSARILSLSVPGGEEKLKEAIYRTLKANNLEEAYLRLTISRGEGGTGPDVADNLRVSTVIVAESLPLYPNRWYEKGVKAVVVKVRRDETSPLSRIKSLNYLPNILARLEAKNKEAEEGLML
ncbi:aminotransferase class IV, partial [candidate division NPL-UPA2 bacterium]|nr:aminotransferase class IV [candidate division NPL-UPA2 bacterium]